MKGLKTRGVYSAGASAACAPFFLLGCAEEEGPRSDIEPQEIQGEFTAVIPEIVPENTGIIVQDVSPIVGQEASFEEGIRGYSEEWVIMASCGTAETVSDSATLEVAVIPASEYTAELAEAV